MKWIRRLGLLVLGLATVFLVGGSFMSPKFSVTRSEAILASPEQVFALLVDPRSWLEWTVWRRRDPGMTVQYSGTPSGAGATWSWESKSHGAGSVTFTQSEPGKRIAFELRLAGCEQTSRGELTLVGDDRTTQVTWTLQGDMGSNLLLRWVALLMDPLVGRDFSESLANLKTLAERA